MMFYWNVVIFSVIQETLQKLHGSDAVSDMENAAQRGRVYSKLSAEIRSKLTRNQCRLQRVPAMAFNKGI
jgi:hypothetical protein